MGRLPFGRLRRFCRSAERAWPNRGAQGNEPERPNPDCSFGEFRLTGTRVPRTTGLRLAGSGARCLCSIEHRPLIAWMELWTVQRSQWKAQVSSSEAAPQTAEKSAAGSAPLVTVSLARTPCGRRKLDSFGWNSRGQVFWRGGASDRREERGRAKRARLNSDGAGTITSTLRPMRRSACPSRPASRARCACRTAHPTGRRLAIASRLSASQGQPSVCRVAPPATREVSRRQGGVPGAMATMSVSGPSERWTSVPHLATLVNRLPALVEANRDLERLRTETDGQPVLAGVPVLRGRLKVEIADEPSILGARQRLVVDEPSPGSPKNRIGSSERLRVM
jgi:hypothetical protein